MGGPASYRLGSSRRRGLNGAGLWNHAAIYSFMKCAILRATQAFQALNLIFLQLEKERPNACGMKTNRYDMCIRLKGSKPTASVGFAGSPLLDELNDVTATAIANPAVSSFAALDRTPSSRPENPCWSTARRANSRWRSPRGSAGEGLATGPRRPSVKPMDWGGSRSRLIELSSSTYCQCVKFVSSVLVPFPNGQQLPQGGLGPPLASDADASETIAPAPPK